jgi:hypothetical protein
MKWETVTGRDDISCLGLGVKPAKNISIFGGGG